MERDRAEGGCLTPQVAQRPAGLLLGWESTFHPFRLSPAYQPYADMDPRERVERVPAHDTTTRSSSSSACS